MKGGGIKLTSSPRKCPQKKYDLFRLKKIQAIIIFSVGYYKLDKQVSILNQTFHCLETVTGGVL